MITDQVTKNEAVELLVTYRHELNVSLLSIEGMIRGRGMVSAKTLNKAKIIRGKIARIDRVLGELK